MISRAANCDRNNKPVSTKCGHSRTNKMASNIAKECLQSVVVLEPLDDFYAYPITTKCGLVKTIN